MALRRASPRACGERVARPVRAGFGGPDADAEEGVTLGSLAIGFRWRRSATSVNHWIGGSAKAWALLWEIGADASRKGRPAVVRLARNHYASDALFG